MTEQLLLIGLAAWRLTILISRETGPGEIFLRLRERLFGIEHDPATGRPDSWPSSFLPQMIVCPLCLGAWMAAGVWVLWQISPSAVLVLAAWGLVVLIVEGLSSLERRP